MIARAPVFILAGWIITAAAAAAQTTTAEFCRQQHANDPGAQLTCARQAHANPAQTAQQQPPLVAPLVNMQLIFGFFDRRFAGFNNGLEHLGVDLTATAGTTVAAICDGTVISNNTSHAETVAAVLMVEHDCPPPLGRVFAYYGHVHSELLPGVAVTAGSGMGTIREWPGNSHLHLGLSTRLHDDAWGWAGRGARMQELEAQGWLNPVAYLPAIQPRQAGSGAARAPAARAPAAKARGPAAKRTVNRRR